MVKIFFNNTLVEFFCYEEKINKYINLLYGKFYKKKFIFLKNKVSLYVIVDNCYYLKTKNSLVFKTNSIYEICNYVDFYIQQIFINSDSDFAIHCACIKYKKSFYLFIGAGGSGKSTIVSHCLEEFNNCIFLSDETLLVKQKRIISFPRSILVKKSNDKLTENNLLFDFDRRAYLIPKIILHRAIINSNKIQLFFLDFNDTIFSIETISQIKAMDLLRKNLLWYNKNTPKNILNSLINITEGENYFIRYKTWEQVLDFIK